MRRKSTIVRSTKETNITLTLTLDGAGKAAVDSGVPFLDHMLVSFSRHGHFDLTLRAKGDLHVDAHHTFEDIGLVFGQALGKALGDRVGINRFGWAVMPMDEALVRVAVDLSGRPYLGYRVHSDSLDAGGVNVRLFREFFQALVNTGGLTLHIDLLAGEEVHHIMEVMFKAFGKALDQAVRADPRGVGVPSTKGVLV